MSDSVFGQQAPAGWYRDPFGQGDGRYWDGQQWSDAVSRGGVTLNLPPDPRQATIPPVPGSELRAPTAYAATPSAAPAPPPKRGITGIVIVVVVILAIVGAIFFFVANNDDDNPTTPTTPSVTAPPVTVPPLTVPPVTVPPVTTPPATDPTATTAAP